MNFLIIFVLLLSASAQVFKVFHLNPDEGNDSCLLTMDDRCFLFSTNSTVYAGANYFTYTNLDQSLNLMFTPQQNGTKVLATTNTVVSLATAASYHIVGKDFHSCTTTYGCCIGNPCTVNKFGVTYLWDFTDTNMMPLYTIIVGNQLINIGFYPINETYGGVLFAIQGYFPSDYFIVEPVC